MAEISVSILDLDKENATKTMYNLETAHVDYFHIDVMDGEFVSKNNLELMKDYAITLSHISNLPLDVHLMVKNVKEIMDEYIDLAPDRITIQFEAIDNSEDIMNIIKKLNQNGIKIGIAINPETKIDKIKDYLNYIHMVNIMTVVAGKGGQKLIPETIQKISNLKKYITDNDIDIDIEADGGINSDNAEMVRAAGADILVSGNYILNSEDFKEAVKNIKG